jgi:hypothetical protein
LALAVLWLIMSVVVGLKLMQDNPEAVSALDVSTPQLATSSDHVVYGGDAYSGIQNAASDTEHAVVDGVNEMAKFQLQLQQAVATEDRQRWSLMQSKIEDGFGYLVIGVGVLNLTVALTRLTKSG